MEKILESAVTQVPAMVLLLLVVIAFLKAQDKRDIAFMAALKTRDDVTEAIAKECHTVARSATTAAMENSRAMGRVEKSLDQSAIVMADTACALRERQAG